MNPELALIAACCRWPDDDERRAAIATAAQAVADWPRAAALAGAHRVEGLVEQGLRSAAVDPPQPVAGALAAAAAEIRLLSLRQIGEMLRIDEALASAGLQHLFVKGVALGVAAYGSATLKHSWDIDLLVAPGDAVAAAQTLTGLGYASRNRRPLDRGEFKRWSAVAKEVEFVSDRGITIELHWRLADHPGLLHGMGVGSLARRVALIGERQVATLGDAPCLAYLAVHGAAHCWSRLKWLADFGALLAARPAAERASLIAAARPHGTGRALDQALSLAERWLGQEFQQAAPPVGLDRTANRRLVELAERVITARAPGELIEDHRSARRAIGSAQWLLAPGLGNLCQEAVRRLRGSEDRRRWAMPAALGWFYWMIRPFTALSRTALRLPLFQRRRS